MKRNIDETTSPKQSFEKLQLREVSQPSTSTNPITKKEPQVLVHFYSDREGLYGYQTVTGKMVIEPKFEDAKVFSEGLGAVFNGQCWGYIDESGMYVVRPIYGGFAGDVEIVVHPFVNGTAAVYLGFGNANGFADVKVAQYALIDRQGAKIKMFDTISPTWYGYGDGKVGEYRVTIDDKVYIVDSQGNILKEGF